MPRSGREHSGLDGHDVEVLHDGSDLRRDDGSAHRSDGRDADRVLGRHRSHGTHAVHVMRRERLQVGLDTSAAAGVAAGNRERGPHGEHSLVSPQRVVWTCRAVAGSRPNTSRNW